MKTQRLKDWPSFNRWVLRFSSQSSQRQSQFLFRGHADASWTLEPTLDRSHRFLNDAYRRRYIEDSIEIFYREVVAIGGHTDLRHDQSVFELLARHHGLPSALLDWSRSPYIASFFAFERASERPAGLVAIFVLDRAGLELDDDDLELIDETELIRQNPRALRQRGVFLRVATIRRSVEDLLHHSLTKLLLPASEQDLALKNLDTMRISAVELFGDLDSAARTAAYRMSSLLAASPEGRLT